MSGVITKAIISCIKRGKQVKVAQRYLRAKYNLNIGNKAFLLRVQHINEQKP